MQNTRMTYGITDLTTFILGTIFIVLLPGPNSVYVMTVASRQGVARGYRGAAGIFVGDTLLMILSATGVAGLLHSNPLLFYALKYAGAAYLAWLGFKLLKGGWLTWRGKHQDEQGTLSDDKGSRPFRTALLVSLLNPKAILFFVSFFIQFVDPGYGHPVLSFLILGLIVQTCSVIYLTVLIFAGARLAQQFRRHRRMSAAGTGFVGAAFIGFSVKLATASMR
jgi:leucine efflux protein